MAWFDDKPEILQDEIDRLAILGVQYKVDEEERLLGMMVIKVKYQIEDDLLELDCRFPPEYPFFPVEISCCNFPSGRHIDPIGKSLCLFADKNNNWNISKDTLAGIIQNQVTEIYRIHKNPSVISEQENALEGYQPSGQLQAEDNSLIVVTSDVDTLPECGKGCINLHPIKDAKAEPLKGCLSVVATPDGRTLFQDETGYAKRFSKKFPIRWVKLKKPLKTVSAKGILEQVVSDFPALQVPSYSNFGRIEIDIVAVCFEEETSRNRLESNWLFLVRRTWKQNKKKYESVTIIRSDHLHPNQLLARTPSLVGLAEKTVTVIGVGALGSQVAIQLARAGVKNFNLIDRDILQVGNLQRWVVGLPFVGMSKVQAVAQLLNTGYVGVNVRPFNCEVGGRINFEFNDCKYVDMESFLKNEIINQSDIVIDCTAMLNVNQYLCNLCKMNDTDYIWCSATNGAWGGIVGRSLAAYENNVWQDFNSDYGDKVYPPIAAEPSGFVQPKGCFHPTFTGTGFDLDTISNMACRMAVSILQGEKYGSFDFDVVIVEQWKNGIPVTPKWKELKYQNG